jgi:uncharacterized protein (DUF1697 family)
VNRYFAFLRAINVGSRTVKMDYLKKQFEEAGFTNVDTFLASGNVAFETDSADTVKLEQLIERLVQKTFYFEAATFIRTGEDLVSVASYQPVLEAQFAEAVAYNVAFLKTIVDPEAELNLLKNKTEIDDFMVRGREVYWICKVRQSQSTFSNAVLEKILGGPSTLRGMSTVIKMVNKYHLADLTGP